MVSGGGYSTSWLKREVGGFAPGKGGGIGLDGGICKPPYVSQLWGGGIVYNG